MLSKAVRYSTRNDKLDFDHSFIKYDVYILLLSLE
jgi:hypothetical protein